MPILVTLYAERFEVRWMISTTLAKFKRVMTMGVVIFYLLFAILTDTFITFIDKLLKFDPIVYLRTTKPRVSNVRNFVYFEVISHALSRIALHRRTVAFLALPSQITPRPHHKEKPNLPCITPTGLFRPYRN